MAAGLAVSSMVYIPVGEHRMRLYHEKGQIVRKVQCHEKMRKPLKKALDCTDKILPSVYPLTYHGCYNNRTIAGRNKISRHAYGMAIDLNAGRKQHLEVVKCFEDAGFTWGGRWRGKQRDPHHYQLKEVK